MKKGVLIFFPKTVSRCEHFLHSASGPRWKQRWESHYKLAFTLGPNIAKKMMLRELSGAQSAVARMLIDVFGTCISSLKPQLARQKAPKIQPKSQGAVSQKKNNFLKVKIPLTIRCRSFSFREPNKSRSGDACKGENPSITATNDPLRVRLPGRDGKLQVNRVKRHKNEGKSEEFDSD